MNHHSPNHNQRLLLRLLSWIIIFAVSALTFFLGMKASLVNFSGSVSDLIVVDDDQEDFLRRINESSNNLEQLVLMVRGKNLLSLEGIKVLREITSDLSGLECLDSVTSIANLKIPRAQPFTMSNSENKRRMGICYALQHAEQTYLKVGSKVPKELIFKKGQWPTFPQFNTNDMKRALYYIDNFSVWEALPETVTEMQSFTEDVNNQVYLRNFISPDGTHAAILLAVKPQWVAGLKVVKPLETAMEKLRNRYGQTYSVVLAGNLLLQDEMKKNIALDTNTFIIAGLLLALASFWLAYRTVRGVVLPLLALIVSEVWVLGIMGCLGLHLNIVLYIVPIFILAVGSSATIHVISHFYSNISKGQDKITASVNSVRMLFLPICSASTTTAFGLAALTLSSVKGLNTFVLLTVAGLGIITILSLLFIPALNILLPEPRDRQDHKFISDRRWKPFISFLTHASIPVWILFIILGIIAGRGIFMIDTDNDLTKLLDRNSEVLKISDDVSRNLAGTTLMTLVLESVPGWAVKKDFLEKLSLLQSRLEESDKIDKTTSLADIFKLTNFLASKGNPDSRGRLPAFQYQINSHMQLFSSMEGVEGYKAFGEALRNLLTNFASDDFSTAKILIRSNLTSLKEMNTETRRTIELVREILGPHVKPRIIGGIVDVNKAVEKILFGQTQGVVLALATIFLLMLLLFFSTKIAIICILPNIFPILFFYGSLGLFAIGLDLSAGLVACVAIGIAVDDTIHFMTELKRQLEKTYDTEKAIVETEKIVGSPIILTKIVLAVLFGILVFSRFPVMANLGWLQAGTMVTCLLCNLVLLPALLARVRLISVWDILKGLNFDPTQAVVFKGMSKFAIKVFLSMGKLEDFKEGDIVMETGSPGDSMHIIIEGTARVDYHDALNRCTRSFNLSSGQVFGEIALLSRKIRKSTVKATGELKTIAITKEFFKNAEAFHPRICNRFLINVIENLSERLIGTDADCKGAEGS
ncbi:MAG: hypothetical protein CVV64_00490 [Candidatus Wallbacteria bacterium HGW-Wallbacteria-1]|jgi:hypothetical protein|uniref:Cyclic nucleotide-binding domain-containing protein n=1 Tax=Candidatus Wallbacteria bacterium HGW-Wallbacteria-1 TaxID=2013854 RepID=A0A2N1PUD8_9BACT|nr:MAG: hypothetical protein CVV64_00490 [Candidatus Wallbacteria bacterium HGW-Wallbacteria-1]